MFISVCCKERPPHHLTHTHVVSEVVGFVGDSESCEFSQTQLPRVHCDLSSHDEGLPRGRRERDGLHYHTHTENDDLAQIHPVCLYTDSMTLLISIFMSESKIIFQNEDWAEYMIMWFLKYIKKQIK